MLLNTSKDTGLAVNIAKTKCMAVRRHRGMMANQRTRWVVRPNFVRTVATNCINFYKLKFPLNYFFSNQSIAEA